MLFPPTIAGSLPKPAWLAETEKLWPKWKLEGDNLDQAKREVAAGELRALGAGAELARQRH